MRTVFLLPLLLPAAALALTPQPASLHVTLTDADHHPIPNAAIALTSTDEPSAKPQSATSDPAGQATLTQSADAVTWMDWLTISAPGFIPFRTSAYLFSHADIDLHLRLNPAQTTTLTLLTPDQKPAANFPFNLSYSFINEGERTATGNYYRDPTFLTDANGRYTLTHPPLTGDFTLLVGSRKLHLPAGPALSATLTAEEVQRFTPPVSLHLTVLNPDGSPASGWFVAPHVEFRGNSGSIPGGTMYQLIAPRWEPLSAAGQSTIAVPSRCLLLLSPEGMPLFYALDPQAWSPGIHTLTLTLPPVEKTIAGRFVDPAGKPLANIPLFANGILASTWGTFRIEAPNDGSYAAMATSFPDGAAPPTPNADAEGRFSLPIRLGNGFDHWYAGSAMSGPRYSAKPEIGEADMIVLTPFPRHDAAPADMKEVTLQFLDPAGKPVPESQIPLFDALDPALHRKPANFGHPVCADRSGFHFFVAKSQAGLTIYTEEGTWKSVVQSFDLSSQEHQTVTLRFTEAERNKPLAGRVLDSHGKPVANVRVVPGDENSPTPASNKHRTFNALVTTTGADGRFSIPAAPDTCDLYVGHADADGNSDLPFTPKMPVTPDQRDLTITLPPFVSPPKAAAEEKPAPASATRFATLTVTADSKPLAGAEVAIFIEGPVPGRINGNGVSPLTLDLSDDQGHVRFPLPPEVAADTPAIALARVRGPAGKALQGSLSFNLSATDSLALSLTPDPDAPHPVFARPPNPAPPFPQSALLLLENSDATWSTPHWLDTP